MQSELKLPNATATLLRCPRCHADLVQAREQLCCTDASCSLKFPVIDGIAVVINEAASVFTFDDFISNRETTLVRNRPGPLKNMLEKILGPERFVHFKTAVRSALPTISKNIKGATNYSNLARLLLKSNSQPRVLILGGGIVGQGMEPLLNNPAIEFVESDVSFGPRTKLICDAHDIPFKDGTFDAIIAQAVRARG